jgi:hypothetical protein
MLAPLLLLLAAAAAPPPQHCIAPAVVLWGDGRHDDTKALQAWLDGRSALWGDSGAPVGAMIAGRAFRLSAAVYVPAGSGRTLEHFRFYFPARRETVSGGTIRAGLDPNRAPTMAGVHIIGGDEAEGRPLALPDPPPPRPAEPAASCGIS